MNILDIILLLCFIPAVISGLKKGFIAQVIAIISIIFGAWMSFKFATVVSGWIKGWTDLSSNIIDIIAFVLIFVAVIFGLFALGKLIEASIKIIMLGWLNKLLGVVFALLKFLLIAGMIVLAFDALNGWLGIVSEKSLDNSVLYRAIRNVANSVFPYLKGLLLK